MVVSHSVSDAPSQENGDDRPKLPDRVTLFLAGDTMVGRGVDQVLPHPCDPQLFEPHVTSAADYVELAERANGPIARPVDFAYVWGDALAELDRRRPDLRVINLETAITTSADPEAKGINYRMNPKNAQVLSAARVDCCCLANNHVLDWGEPGLVQTLKTLADAGVKTAGAGRTLNEAATPAILPVPHGRVIVLAFGAPTSGIPAKWAATDGKPGVQFLPELAPRAVDTIASQVQAVKTPGDIVVVSLHWGENWGYRISRQQVAFAHGLIDQAGVDIVFGHSSHHPKAMEVHHGKLILYGCGDFINDYEGIRGYEAFRDDLVLMYFPTLHHADGALHQLAMVPLQIRNLRLNRAERRDAEWLCDVLNRERGDIGAKVSLEADNTLTLG